MTALEYIRILFYDCGFDTVKQREAFINREFGAKYEGPIHYADELNSQDRLRLIEILKDIKAGQQERSRADSREDTDA